MGGVHKKPISVIEKRTRRMLEGKAGRREKRPLSETEKRERSVIVTPELLRTIESGIREFKVITPYLIMTKYDILRCPIELDTITSMRKPSLSIFLRNRV